MAAGLAAMLALVVLLLPGPAAALALPVGLPGAPLSLALDPLCGGFLLLVAVAGTAVIVFAAEASRRPDRPIRRPPGDRPRRAAARRAGRRRHHPGARPGPGRRRDLGDRRRGDPRRPIAGRRSLCVLVAAAAVIVALALLAPAGGGCISPRSAPPGRCARAPGRAGGDHRPGRAARAGAAALAGPGASRPARPGRGTAVGRRCCPPRSTRCCASCWTSARPPPRSPASVPLLLAGAAAGAAGRLARLPGDGTGHRRGLRLAAPVRHGGLRAWPGRWSGERADLPDLAALALSAVLLLAAMQAVCGTLAVLSAGAIRQQAGTRRLDRLGGLAHAHAGQHRRPAGRPAAA